VCKFIILIILFFIQAWSFLCQNVTTLAFISSKTGIRRFLDSPVIDFVSNCWSQLDQMLSKKASKVIQRGRIFVAKLASQTG
jgi:hypothetical protein